ncbi:MAG TPA: LytTR family DNA-binding domain-containing protein [Fulvivirga sp.]|nr:LytTR family DNA-binding domain-containing protein [Fulvivirga sp.]
MKTIKLIEEAYLWRKQIAISVFCLLFIITFEVFQQYFYVVYFDLASDKFQLSDVFIGQMRGWAIWLMVSIPFILYVKQKPLNKHNLNASNFFSYFLGILFMIAINVAFISIVQVIISDLEMTKSLFIETIVFYIFQKGPIYFIAYTMLLVLTHFFIYAETMELKVQELAELKRTNKTIYDDLIKRSYKDSTFVINVKIGNRWKVVPLDTITWIEADDYCVKLHVDSGKAYTIRTSMKELENKLSKDLFIRTHRKSIVNIACVKEYSFAESPQIVLYNGVSIPIAKNRLKEVKLLLQPGMRISS